MTLFIVSFIAGVLTVLAPCILPLLPVILGGAVADAKNRRRPLVIIAALSISVFAFTLLLKGSTALIDVSPSFWTYVSAVILFAFGLTLLFPIAWAKLLLRIPGHSKPDAWLNKGYQKGGSVWADIVVGAALGPVFTTCSPTFFVILATVLPQSLGKGLIDLLAYIIGLALALLLISAIGQKLVNKLEWASNPEGWFKRTLGALFIVLAILIAFGYDKKIETAILNSGFFDVTTLEQKLHQALEKSTIPGTPGLQDENSSDSTDPTASSSPIDSNTSPTSGTASSSSAVTSSGGVLTKAPLIPSRQFPKFIEIAKPAGFVNSVPFKLADIAGKKVILIDFIDYSCINCERTFPYMNDWYAKYKNQGLEIVAMHTPEFAFEKIKSNVEKAAVQFGLKFPIVLDNDYATWTAYGNQYWPHKYLIDIHGNIVYDHIGEGGDAEVEAEIVKLLNERKMALNEPGTVKLGQMMPDYSVQARSPETYFGYMRNEYFGNGSPNERYTQTFTVPENSKLSPNTFYLGGKWDIEDEYIQTQAASAQISYIFNAAKMYLIAEAPVGAAGQAGMGQVRILIDGKLITPEQSGTDVKNGTLKIDASRLYNIFSDKIAGQHRIDVIFDTPGVKAYTFTFG